MRIIDELTAMHERNSKKNARTTDLLEDIDRGYRTDGHGDVDDRP